MLERRNLRILANLAIAILGGGCLAVASYFVVRHIVPSAPDPARILGGTLIMALAMLWTCWFTVRAFHAEDEYQRQAEMTDSFWGAWLGIAASAPVFFFIGIGGLIWLDPAGSSHVRPFGAFVTGYLLPILCAALGAVVARVLRRLRVR